jgi:peroxiredoxin
VGVSAPGVELPFALEGVVSLAALAGRHSLVVFFYPGVGPRAGESEGEGNGGNGDGGLNADVARVWGWREHEPELAEMGYVVVGISTQSAEEQLRFASSELVECVLLSDRELELAGVLGLPMVSVAGRRVYEPLTLVMVDGRIGHVVYPVDPERETTVVLDWIRGRKRRTEERGMGRHA